MNSIVVMTKYMSWSLSCYFQFFFIGLCHYKSF